MTRRRLRSSLLAMGLMAVVALPAHAGAEQIGDDPPPRQRVGADPAKAKAQEAERQRLVAKLRAEAPKLDDAPPPAHPLAVPIFNRHDRR